MSELERCFNELVDVMNIMRTRLSPREQLIFEAGLHASHAEEAMLTAGDELRAKAHFRGLVQNMQKLGLLR